MNFFFISHSFSVKYIASNLQLPKKFPSNDLHLLKKFCDPSKENRKELLKSLSSGDNKEVGDFQ